MEKKFEFTHFQKVLVRDEEYDEWQCDLYSSYKSSEALPYGCVGNRWKYCIPYEGNEHLCDTTDSYVEPYEPKDGDFVHLEMKDYSCIFIKRDGEKKTECYAISNFSDDEIRTDTNFACYDHEIKIILPATDEETKQFLSKLHEIGKDWNAEKKEIVDLKWIPNDGGVYYYPKFYSLEDFVAIEETWRNDEYDRARFNRGFAFRTKEECQALCDKLKEAIKNVK